MMVPWISGGGFVAHPKPRALLQGSGRNWLNGQRNRMPNKRYSLLLCCWWNESCWRSFFFWPLGGSHLIFIYIHPITILFLLLILLIRLHFLILRADDHLFIFFFLFVLFWILIWVIVFVFLTQSIFDDVGKWREVILGLIYRRVEINWLIFRLRRSLMGFLPWYLWAFCLSFYSTNQPSHCLLNKSEEGSSRILFSFGWWFLAHQSFQGCIVERSPKHRTIPTPALLHLQVSLP